MQLTRETVNGFRYQVAVNTEGQDVMAEAVKWTYKGGQRSVKEFLKSEGCSNKKYKEMFTTDQQRVLDAEPATLHDVASVFRSYDISILYVIAQNCCGLKGPKDSAWRNGTSLEHLLYRLKKERNVIAHTRRVEQISDAQLVQKLQRLKDLLSKILHKACLPSGRPKNPVRARIAKTEDAFKRLQSKVREPLDPSDFDLFPQLQEEMEVFHSILLEKVVEDSRQELYARYPQVWGVCLAKWLLPDLRVRPRLTFSKLIMKEVVTWALPTQQEPKTIAHEDLLHVRRLDGSLPEVLIICGDGGMGKTTFFKFLLETWVKNPSQIKGLEDLTHLLFFQLRGSTINSWRDLLRNIFPETFSESRLSSEFFQDLFMRLPIVLLLDGYDEANEESKRLITDLLNIRSNMRLVISTRSVCLKDLTQIVRSKRQVMNVEIRGMQWEDCLLYVENAVDDIEKDPTRRFAMKSNVIRHLKNIKLETGELNAPLTMKLLIVRELLAPDKDSQDIYEDLTVLMMGKTEERLTVKHIEDSEDKIRDYYEFQKKIALRGLKRHEHDLLPETVKELKEKCRSLGLPHKEILSGFLTSKTKLQDFKVAQVWSYPHTFFQEHWAASHIAKQLSEMSGFTREEQPEDLFKNPLFQVYFEGPAEAEQLLQEDGCSQKELMVSVISKAIGLLSSPNESLLNTLARGIAGTLPYNDPTFPSQEQGCNAICRFVRSAGLRSSVVRICAEALRGHDTWRVEARFLREIVALTDYSRPRRIILLAFKEDLEEGPTGGLRAAQENLLLQRHIELERHPSLAIVT